MVRVATRPSILALKQVEECMQQLKGIAYQPVIIATTGDNDKVTPLPVVQQADFFTRQITAALIAGEADVAIHSAKDLEADMPDDVQIIAMTPSISRHDCLVSRFGAMLDDLSAGSVIGTSSFARQEGIRNYRADLAVKNIRGNVDERLRLLDAGYYDAIIVAHAALIRLGLTRRIVQIIPGAIIMPHPLQGRLAIQAHKDRHDMRTLFKGLHDENDR